MHISRDTNTLMFMRAYQSFLNAEGKMAVDQFIPLYQQMHPALHKYAGEQVVDTEAFVYAYLRIPYEIIQIQTVVLAQTDDIFRRGGCEIPFWEEVETPARRRKMYFDGKDTLAMVINSTTDVDDIICLLTALQIEWNKMHELMHRSHSPIDTHNLEALRSLLHISPDKWSPLIRVIGSDPRIFSAIYKRRMDVRVSLLRGSYTEYKKATQRWLETILEETRYKNLRKAPLYLVSSNTHSLINTMTGWVQQHEALLIDYLKQKHMEQFLHYWNQISAGDFPGSKENFLWYILKKYEKDVPEIKKERYHAERALGIDYVAAQHFLDIDAQVFAVKDLPKSNLPQKLQINLDSLAASEAIVINYDYPLGYGAYMVLSTILRNINQVQGIYILGKASFLNGNLGDIALPTTVYDSHSKNTFMFHNVFTPHDFSSFRAGNILKEQKVVSTEGTLLHPPEATQQFFLNGYSIIEMEDGPYLNALYETSTYNRYPTNEVINMTASPIDIGIIHYASDTPYTKAITLGTRSLGYEGVEATYVSSLAMLKRIVTMER